MNEIRRESIWPPLWVFTLFLMAIGLWLLFELKEMVALLVIGYSVAYLIEPLIKCLERRRVPRSAGLFIVFGAAALIVLVLTLTAVPVFYREYRSLAANMPRYVALASERANDLLDRIPEAWLNGRDSVADLMPSLGGDAAGRVLQGAAATLLKGYSITLTILNLFLLPFIVFYLSVGFESIHRTMLGLFPYQYRPKVQEVVGQIDRHISGFVHGQLVVASILTCLYLIGLGALRIELWVLLGIISGAGHIVPYLGFVVGIVLSSVMALVTHGDLMHVVLVWVVFTIVQTLEGVVITPKVLGDRVGLSPLVVILAIFAGGKLFGLLGIFLAVPGAATLRVLLHHFHAWIMQRYRQLPDTPETLGAVR